MAAQLNIGGVVPPLVTPLDESRNVDRQSVQSLVDYQLEAGVDGLFALGSSGEAALLSNTTRLDMLRATSEAVAGRAPVLAGAIEMSTERVIELVPGLEDGGADALVVTAPFYTRTSQEEIDAHFRAVASATNLPVFAYDIPVSVPTRPSREVILRLAEDGVLAGLKDSSGDDANLRALVMERNRRGLQEFRVFTGSELMVDAAIGFGVDGVVPGLGNVDPSAYVNLFQDAKAGYTGDSEKLKRARQGQDRLIELFGLVNAGDPARMGRGSSALGAFKTALMLLDIIGTNVTALPYVTLDSAEADTVRSHLEAAGLL